MRRSPRSAPGAAPSTWAREIPVPVVDRLKLAAIDRDHGLGKKTKRAGKLDEPGTDLADGRAISRHRCRWVWAVHGIKSRHHVVLCREGAFDEQTVAEYAIFYFAGIIVYLRCDQASRASLEMLLP